MDIGAIRLLKQQLEKKAAEELAEIIAEFEEKTSLGVEGVQVTIDTFGTPSRTLQRSYEPPQVTIQCSGI